MIRLIPAFRASVVAVGLMLATVAVATAEEEAAAAKPFKPTIYVGPAFGVAFQDYDNDSSTEFGWAMQVLARPIQWLGLQLEYFNLGSIPQSSGEFDGVYVGLMPILPLPAGFDLYGQVGAAFADAGDDVAAGAGVMYEVPVEFLEANKVDLVLRADYKYFNMDEGQHELLFGVMFGLHK